MPPRATSQSDEPSKTSEAKPSKVSEATQSKASEAKSSKTSEATPGSSDTEPKKKSNLGFLETEMWWIAYFCAFIPEPKDQPALLDRYLRPILCKDIRVSTSIERTVKDVIDFQDTLWMFALMRQIFSSKSPPRSIEESIEIIESQRDSDSIKHLLTAVGACVLSKDTRDKAPYDWTRGPIDEMRREEFLEHDSRMIEANVAALESLDERRLRVGKEAKSIEKLCLRGLEGRASEAETWQRYLRVQQEHEAVQEGFQRELAQLRSLKKVRRPTTFSNPLVPITELEAVHFVEAFLERLKITVEKERIQIPGKMAKKLATLKDEATVNRLPDPVRPSG